MLLIVGLFLIAYLLRLIFTIVALSSTKRACFMKIIDEALLVLLFLSSALNPFLFCLRMTEIRLAVKNTLKHLVYGRDSTERGSLALGSSVVTMIRTTTM